jgi:hypothetical protein
MVDSFSREQAGGREDAEQQRIGFPLFAVSVVQLLDSVAITALASTLYIKDPAAFCQSPNSCNI